MTLETNITKIGDSHYILVPSYLAKSFCIENGQKIEVRIENDTLIFTLKKEADKNDIRKQPD